MSGADPPTQDSLYGILANETRLRIVEALGDLSERGEYSTIPFSDLKREVGVDDSGKFSYHLNRLVDHYVAGEEGGYRLRLPGIRVYQSLQTWSEEPVTVEPFPLPFDCEVCDGALHCGYRDGRFRITCQSCDTMYNIYPLDSGAFDPDDPDSLHEAAITRIRRDFTSMFRRMCPYCSGRVTMTIEDVEARPYIDGPADDIVIVLHACEGCNWFVYSKGGTLLATHPETISFLYDRGMNVFETAPWNSALETDESVESSEPLRIEVRFVYGDDELRLLVDRELQVIESELRSSPSGSGALAE